MRAAIPDRTRMNSPAAFAPWVFVLMWASGAIFAELGLRYASPVPFLAVRAVLAALIAWAVTRWTRDTRPVGRGTRGRVVVVGLVTQVGYQGMFFLALDLGVSAGMLAAVLGMQPLLTASIAGRRHAPWAGLVIGLVGIVLVVFDRADPRDVLTALDGVGAALAAMVCLTLGTIAQRQLTGIGLWRSIAIQHTAASCVFVLLALALKQAVVDPGPGFWVAEAWMAVVVSTGATALLYAMARTGNATRVASLFYLVPPVTAVLDLVVFGTGLRPHQWFGMAAVVISVFLVERSTANDSGSHTESNIIDRVKGK
ncbi:DMT family transporter [Streptomyces sp. NPDC048420]|uniref:DMT family transporter n=1 Tax=Streptomyces sp. NPDC048420 TaxID=3155755 RepID=UPI00341F804A